MSPRFKTLRRAAQISLAVTVTVFALAASSDSAHIALSEDATLGQILVDSEGNTLYLFLPDAQGDSTCYDTCAENWPPLLVEGDAVVGEGLDSELVGTITRTDDSEQLTYGGWPLYTFVGDSEPGQTAGQGVNDVWFVVDAQGQGVGVPDSEAAEGESASEDEANGADDGAEGAGQGDGDLMAAYMKEGAAVFSRICAACHGANGDESLASHVAILANNSRLQNGRMVAHRVINGGTYMPAFGAALSDREVAAVATFVRNSFGNEYGLVGEEEAAALR